MSRIGKKIITIPDDVEVKIDGKQMEFKGSGGTIDLKVPMYIKVQKNDKDITFEPENESKQARANWGTIRALAQNAISGVIKGFEKSLEIEGVGYRVNMEGNVLVLSLGFSHPVKFNPPAGVKIAVEKNTIKISGISKELVGRTAAQIRALKKVEPYKGKGIRYTGEVVRRKAGKKVAGAGAAK